MQMKDHRERPNYIDQETLYLSQFAWHSLNGRRHTGFKKEAGIVLTQKIVVL